jgi:predicted metalloendopeptidase
MENIDQKQANKYRLQDIHAAGCLRVNGNVYLMDEFYRVFNITKGKMYLSPEKRFLIW